MIIPACRYLLRVFLHCRHLYLCVCVVWSGSSGGGSTGLQLVMTHVALANLDADVDKSKKQSKKGKVEKKEEQQPTKVILANVAQDSRNEACSTAMVLRHILKLASAVSEALE